MKQTLKKILALTMTLTVLVSSHSFAWFEHLCTITQIKKVSFHAETCAGEFTDANAADLPSLKKGTCCEISVKVNKADKAVQQNFNAGFGSFVSEEISLITFRFEPEIQVISEEPVLNHGDSSPPLPIPLYLLNQQFII